MSNSMLVILTVDGYVNLWEYDNEHKSPPKLINWERLSIDRKERVSNMKIERFLTIAVCPRNLYMAVASCYGDNDSMRRIFLLKVNKKFEIEEKVKTMVTGGNPYYSAFRSMVFFGYFNGFPVLYALEAIGESTLWSFYYDGKHL
jgi:hypothetical protein